MARISIDIDDEACTAVMERFGLSTQQDAVNLALRSLVDAPLTLGEARAMRGTGWTGDVADMRSGSRALTAD